MNIKRIIGLICIVVGIGLLFYAGYGKERMASARQEISDTKVDQGLIPDNPITDPIKENIEQGIKAKYYRKVDSYEPLIQLLTIGGWILIGGGVILLIFGRNKKT